ncbi:hypothetical protein SteCoe_31264 [Stentor coeruleus]|uniref:Uncharacterized protein n=1 Tax=Stentor coeruleus TaxID=5963 RepID=A0A1R2B1N3_9CILI|nr:hypothetical protein SteCoe_31264 [Stentor coeruleus]
MKNFLFCCFEQEEKTEEIEQKSTNMESELSIVDKLNIVKELIRKSVEESKTNRTVQRKRAEIIIAIDHIPVYENVHGQLKMKNESRKVIYTN